MGFDKKNVYRGKCTENGCDCEEYRRTGDGSRCSTATCRHVAVKHVAIHTGATGSHKAATNLPAHHSEDHDVKKCYRCSSKYSSSKHGACITCFRRDQCSNLKCTELAYYDKDLGSFNYCSRECRDEHELKRANVELKRALKEIEVVPGLETSSRAPGGRSSNEKIRYHGVGSTYIVGGVTLNITGNPPTPRSTSSTWSSPFTSHSTSSTWSKQSTSHTTSSTWSKPSTSPSTNSPWINQSSPHMTSNTSVENANQLTTSTETIMTQSDSSSTIRPTPPVVVSHQRNSQTITSQPQSPSQNSLCCFTALSVPASIFNSSNTTFYGTMRGMDIHRSTGILVSAVTLDEESCELRLLDLVTHIDKKAIKGKIGCDGRVCPTHIPTSGEVWLTVQREHHIPPVEELKMSFFDGENVPRTSLGIYSFKLAAVSCTSKDLEKCATFLGVSTEGGAGRYNYGSKKISRVLYGSVGWDIGLSMLHTIVSVAMVTTEKKLIGPEPNWSFEYIKSTARENPGICALLLLLRK